MKRSRRIKSNSEVECFRIVIILSLWEPSPCKLKLLYCFCLELLRKCQSKTVRVRVLLLILKNRTHVLCLGQSTLHKPFHTVDCAENSKRRWELVAKLLAEKTAGLILIGIPIWYFDIFPRRLLYRDLLRKRIKSQKSTGFLISSIHLQGTVL